MQNQRADNLSLCLPSKSRLLPRTHIQDLIESVSLRNSSLLTLSLYQELTTPTIPTPSAGFLSDLATSKITSTTRPKRHRVPFLPLAAHDTTFKQSYILSSSVPRYDNITLQRIKIYYAITAVADLPSDDMTVVLVTVYATLNPTLH